MSAAEGESWEETLAAVDRLVSAFNAGDIDGVLAAADPNVVITTAREWPGGGEYAGRGDVRAFLREFVDTWAAIRYEHEAQENVNGRVVERARWVGRGRTSGIETTVDFHAAWTVTAGVVARADFFARRAQAREFALSAPSVQD